MDNPEIFNRYYNLCLNYLSYRPRSEQEIIDYLNKKAKNVESLTPEMIDQIILKLKEYKFIDDKEFAKAWIRQNIEFKHKPIRAIEFELKQKGIKREVIDDSLLDFDKKDSDLVSAKELANKKMEYYRNIEPKKRQEKVMGFLLRKGFSYDIVKKVLK